MKRHDPPDRKRILSAAPKTKEKCKQFSGFFTDIQNLTSAIADPQDKTFAKYDHDP